MKIYQDTDSIPMDVKHFKYLSRVFYCNADLVEVEQLSDEIQENINMDDELEDKKIIVVQAIDGSNKYQDGKFTSNHPMQFYALGKDEFEERIIIDGPVVFKDKFDPLTNLMVFDQTAQKIPLAYKSEFSPFILEEGLKITRKFEQLLMKMQKVEITEKNMFSAFFTLCHFYDSESQRRKGVLL